MRLAAKLISFIVLHELHVPKCSVSLTPQQCVKTLKGFLFYKEHVVFCETSWFLLQFPYILLNLI